jgi:hypothetical protein
MTGGRSDQPLPTSDGLREVLLTLSAAEFDRFVCDLKLLRQQFAGSNTQAIVEAVHECATRVKVATVHEGKAA